MKALVLEGKQALRLCEIDAPIASNGAKIVTVEAVSVGGSEYLGFNNPGIRHLPSIMGHGFTGTVADGKRVAVYPLSGCGGCQFCIDDQVQLCEKWRLIGVHTHGGFAQKVVVRSDQLFELPANVSWEQSVFIEPFANAINAWEATGAKHKRSVAVIGVGSLGLGLVALANQSHFCKIIHVADLSASRRRAAKTLGATETGGQLTEVYDVVFDTVGSAVTKNNAIQATKKGGTCLFMGFETPELNVNMSEIIRHQKRLMGSFVFSKRHFFDATNLVSVCDSAWVKNVSFSEVEQALVQFCKADFEQVKVALRPQRTSLFLD